MMTKESAALSGEERLIARYFRPLAKHPGAFGLVDDAAVLAPPAGCDLVLKIDGLIGGVHFFLDDPPDAVAKKALRVNLSDLAAKVPARSDFFSRSRCRRKLARIGLSRSRVGSVRTQIFSNAHCSAAIPTERLAQSPSQSRPSAQSGMVRWFDAQAPS